jgi:hypothetical protein
MGKFASSGVVVGQTRSSAREQRLQHQKGARVTMGSNSPLSGEGAVGDITIRTMGNIGLRAYVKTNSGWVDLNSMTALDTIEWRDMILVNSWARFNADSPPTHMPPQYCKDTNGFVHFRGSMKDGSSASASVTTLPPGFRPPKDVICAAAISGAQCSVKITSAGVVSVVNGGSTVRQELDGVSFFAWQSPTSGGHGRGVRPDPGSGGHSPG